jgi:hypothetical protein
MTIGVGDDPRLVALTKLIGHTGASGFQLRYDDNEEPLVWIAVASYEDDESASTIHQVGAGLTPIQAAYRVTESLMDGGQCTHCHRPSAVALDPAEIIGDEVICWYVYRDARQEFVRDCEDEFP